MKILAISYDVPRPDQSSGELRFFSLLSLLAREHELVFQVTAENANSVRDSAIEALERQGVQVKRGALSYQLRQDRYDIIFFEFYFVAEAAIDLARAWQPNAKIIVDSVDVHFHRLRSKARLTGQTSDHQEAEEIRRRELLVYERADLVLTVSDADRQILKIEGLTSETAVIPNIHIMHELQERRPSERLELIFIGSYKWEPNVDAMIYFCSEVVPLLQKEVSNFRLRIVGSSPTAQIKALQGPNVDVVGYVESTTPYLLSSDISIAPLRYGGGIKGKIGEAMAHGLPVVTTDTGAEGFGLIDGHDAMIANSPHEFVQGIVELWRDPEKFERVRSNGRQLMSRRLSVEAVWPMLNEALELTQRSAPKRLSVVFRARQIVPHLFERYVSWRFRK